jgi:ribonuclease T1
MRSLTHLSLCFFIILLAGISGAADTQPSKSDSCQTVVSELNRSLSPKIDEEEFVSVLRTLNKTHNKRLPAKFVTKKQAQKMGWKPGRDLWKSEDLAGKSLGGDIFSNREGRLPDGRRVWREADLDYKGGHRGPKRLIYSDDGLRSVTVDHYNTFKAVPPCE